MKHSKITNHNVIIRWKDSNKIKRSGIKKILTQRGSRQLFRLSTKKGYLKHEISKSFRKKPSHVTVWKSLESNGNVKFMKLLKNSRLLKHHQEERLKWAENIPNHGTKNGSKGYFQIKRKKKCNLDGLDGYKDYWHEIWGRNWNNASVNKWGEISNDLGRF